MLTPDDIALHEFTTVRFRDGYDQGEVDEFLGRVAGTIRAHLERDGDGIELLADDVPVVRFTPTRLREGYDQGEVDEFLDRVVETLRAHEASAGG